MGTKLSLKVQQRRTEKRINWNSSFNRWHFRLRKLLQNREENWANCLAGTLLVEHLSR